MKNMKEEIKKECICGGRGSRGEHGNINCPQYGNNDFKETSLTHNAYIEDKVKEIEEILDINLGLHNPIAKQQLRTSLESLIATVLECVPEEDTTPDANEYERADRMAWNSCRDQFKKNLSEKGIQV